jgi:Protein of unknown function (DUF4230)
MPVLAPERESAASPFPPSPAPSGPARPAGRHSLTRTFAALVVAGLALVGANRLGHLIPHLANPFRTETVDRTGPAVLKALDDLHQYRAATGSFQVLLDVEKDATYLPSFLKGERTLFLANGRVDAGVDFSGLTGEAVVVSPDRRSVTITLPHATLSPATVDPQASYVAARDRGLLDRISSVFSDSPTSERSLYLEAEPRLARAAAEAGLTARAEENTRAMLRGLIGSLGFDDVQVRFEPAL